MKKILVTGFLPFRGMPINPAGEIVKRLEAPDGVDLVKEIMPVEYENARVILRELIQREKPDAVVCFGQAGNRKGMTPEYVAINFGTTRSDNGERIGTDESGKSWDDLPLDPLGPAAYMTTLPVRKMIEASRNADVDAHLSYTAGTFICNAVMYTALREADIHGLTMKAGFVHVPYLPEQMPESQSVEKYPILYSMELSDMVKSAQAMLLALSEEI